jgi:acetyltransferase
MKVMDHKLAVRLTQIDYDREMALVLTDPGQVGDIHAVARYNADPDRQRAEFAIIIGHWLTGMGLGMFLMRRLIDTARRHGIGELFGTVMQENETMLSLCRRLGFTLTVNRGDPGTILVRLNLAEQAA